jgi:undecaprenyl-diphosphatase
VSVEEIIAWDRGAFLVLNDLFGQGWMGRVFESVDHLGDGLVLGTLVILALVAGGRAGLGRRAIFLGACFAAATGLSVAVKLAVARVRPAAAFGAIPASVPASRPVIRLLGGPPLKEHSFPSGHAQAAMTAAMAFGFLYPRLRWLLVGVAVLVALARVAVGAHFPLDVLAGAGIGAACASGVWLAWGRKVVIA